MRVVRTITVLVAIGSIQACSSSFVPPMPPAIDPDIYTDAELLKPDIDSGQFAYSILGVRLAERGFYIDMLVEGPAESLNLVASIVGSSLNLDHTYQETDIQLLDPAGQRVPLLSVSFPPHHFPLPFDNTVYDPVSRVIPPTYPFTAASDGSGVIQVFMRRTRRQYKPGSYRIRLTESWQERHDPEIPPSLVDTAWRNVDVDWTESDPR